MLIMTARLLTLLARGDYVLRQANSSCEKLIYTVIFVIQYNRCTLQTTRPICIDFLQGLKGYIVDQIAFFTLAIYPIFSVGGYHIHMHLLGRVLQ